MLPVLYLYKSVQTTGSFSGIVVDALTNKPIQNIKVIHVVKKDKFFLTACACTAFPLENTEEYYTNKDGRFNIPSKLGFYPFLINTFTDEYLVFNKNTTEAYKKDNVGNKNYFPVSQYKIISKKELTGKNFEYLPDINMVEVLENDDANTKSSIKISLIPTLDSVGDCEKITDSTTKNNCYSLNAWKISSATNDEKMCEKINDFSLQKFCKLQISKRSIKK